MGGILYALLAPSPLPRLHRLAGIVIALAKLQMTGLPVYRSFIGELEGALVSVMSKLPAGNKRISVQLHASLGHESSIHTAQTAQPLLTARPLLQLAALAAWWHALCLASSMAMSPTR